MVPRMTDHEQWARRLEATGAIQRGHFLLSSGLHSPQYVQCARALENPRDAVTLGEELVRRLESAKIDRVVSPPLGALLIGFEVARQLECPFIFPERTDDGSLRLRRGFSVRVGERVAVVEDVITTGRTTLEVVEMLRGLGADVVVLAAIVNRSGSLEVDGLPIESILSLSIPTYERETCPLCRAGIPLVKPGSRKQSEAST